MFAAFTLPQARRGIGTVRAVADVRGASPDGAHGEHLDAGGAESESRLHFRGGARREMTEMSALTHSDDRDGRRAMMNPRPLLCVP